MSRIPSIDSHEDLPPEQQYFYDGIVRTRGCVPPPYRFLLHSPHVADRVASVGEAVLYDTVLAPEIQTLTWLVAAREFDCDLEWAACEPRAKKAGIPQALIDAIRKETSLPEISAKHAALIDFCRQLLRGNHHVTDATYETTVRHFGVPATVQIAATIGYFMMLALVINAFEVQPDGGESELPL